MSAAGPISLTFLLPRPEIGGGTLAVLSLATLGSKLGHSVTVSGEGPLPPELKFPGRYLDRLRAPLPNHQDLWVATFWTTVREARQRGLSPMVHFCQGYEGEIPHFRTDWAAIDEIYRFKVPAWAVSPRLVELLEQRFGKAATLLPPPLSLPGRWFRLRRWFWPLRPRRQPRIALFGAFEAEVKGIAIGLQALRQMKQSGLRPALVRISVLPANLTETAIYRAEEYYTAISPATARAVLAGCDLLLFPVGPEEGFGLPMLEAMVLGVPVVASKTSTTQYIAGGSGAVLVDREPDLFEEAAAALLKDPASWRRQRRLGWRAAQAFSTRPSLARLEKVLIWAFSEARKSSP